MDTEIKPLPIVMANNNVFGERIKKDEPHAEVSVRSFMCSTEQASLANNQVRALLRQLETTPEGYERVEAYIGKGEIVVIGDPDPSEDEETGHNCDAMGCSSVSHVIYRRKITKG